MARRSCRYQQHDSRTTDLVVPKLDWSAPKDATWISATNSMECRTPNDVYLLKSSDFITHDLEQAFDGCEDIMSPSVTAATATTAIAAAVITAVMAAVTAVAAVIIAAVVAVAVAATAVIVLLLNAIIEDISRTRRRRRRRITTVLYTWTEVTK